MVAVLGSPAVPAAVAAPERVSVVAGVPAAATGVAPGPSGVIAAEPVGGGAVMWSAAPGSVSAVPGADEAVSGDGPRAPVSAAVPWVLAAAARRELGDRRVAGEIAAGPVARAEAAVPSFDQIIQYTFFHRSATASPAQSPGQAAPGVVRGTLNAVTGNGAPLVYSLAQAPAGGTVVLGEDGTFTYTAGSALAQSGGTDSFRVNIDNGGPFRLGGIEGAVQGILSVLAQLIGLRQPDTVTVTVPVTISALSLDADGSLSLADLDTLARADAVGATTNEAGLVTALVGSFTGQKVENAAEAMQAFNRIGGLLGATAEFTGDINVETTKFAAGSGGVSQTFYRLTQDVNGVPVLGSEVILSTLQDGTATGVFSGIDPRIYQVDTTPDAGIDSSAEVISAATRILLGRISNPPAGLAQSLTFAPRLVIYGLDPAVAPTLTWQVRIDTTDPAANPTVPVVSTTYYIHANGPNTATLLTEDTGIETAVAVGTTSRTESAPGLYGKSFQINYTRNDEPYYYYSDDELWDQERGIAVYRLEEEGSWFSRSPIETRGDSGKWDQSAVSAMGNMARAVDYYENVLGHEFPEKLTVGVVSGFYNNASAAPGGSFRFGNDSEAALDVVGHELTHTVLDSIIGGTGRFGFTGVDGNALDEAYGDIFGSIIEGKSKDTQARWDIGEDIPSSAYRSMSVIRNPGSEEPHSRGTVFGFAAYTMMTDPRTAGVSDDTWARIFYSSIQRLPANATFDLARGAVIGAALDQGVVGDQLKAIADAFNEAGIRVEDPRVKIVLTWGERPADLDAHLTGPGRGGFLYSKPFHVSAYASKYFSDGTYYSPGREPVVSLEYADTTSYGPESITVSDLTPGDYYFYVHDATNRDSTNSSALSRSEATVEVFTPDVLEIPPTFFGYLFRYITGNVPTTFKVDGSSPGTLWTVFKMTIPSGGSAPKPVITPINSYSYQSDPLNVGNRAPVVLGTPSQTNPSSGVVTGLVNAFDADFDPLSYSIADDVDNGRLSLSSTPAGGFFNYEPDASAREAATPTYSVTTAIRGLDKPTRLLFGRDGTAYVINASSISTIDTTANVVTESTSIGPSTLHFAEANPTGTRVYFTTYGANTVKVFTPGTNAVASFKDFGDKVPTAIGFSPLGSLVYVATVAPDRTGSLSVINAGTGSEGSVIPFGNFASGMVVSQDGAKIYLPGNDESGAGVVTVIDTETKKVTTISGLDAPNDIAITPDGKRLFVTTNSTSGGSLWVYSTETKMVLANVKLTPGLAGYLAVSPDGTSVYASTCDPAEGRSAIVVLTADGAPVKTIDFPVNAVLSPAPTSDGERLYVPDKESTLSVIDTATGHTTDTFVVTVSDGRGGTVDVPVTVPIIPLQ